jgi:ATPase subunit of ABC transporter with duplicated ATPase domains
MSTFILHPSSFIIQELDRIDEVVVGHIDVSELYYELSDGRVLLRDVNFRIGDGAKAAFVGPNGAGKTTLVRLIAGDIRVQEGQIVNSGGLGIMRQFVGSVRDNSTLRDLLISILPPAQRTAGQALAAAERRMADEGSEESQMAYADAITEWGDVGGYDMEVLWDVACMSAFEQPFDTVADRSVNTFSGGEQKRIVLEVLLRGQNEVLLLDEPDNYLDVPGKRWLEEQIVASRKTILFISHDRELLSRAANRIITFEYGKKGNTVWVHGEGFATWHAARQARHERFAELLLRWNQEHERLIELVKTLAIQAKSSHAMAPKYRAMQTRLRRFEEDGPPEAPPVVQDIKVRLKGGRTGVQAVITKGLAIEQLTKPFDLEIEFGDRVAILGGNGTGKSHFLRLLSGDQSVHHTGSWRLGSRVVAGFFAQTHAHPEFIGKTLLDILWTHHSLTLAAAMGVLRRYELTGQAEQAFETLSGGQQARFQILLLELDGATLLLLDEPTDNLDLASAEALEQGLSSFEGTVIAVTHDRWFSRGFDRFVVFGRDQRVYESSEPVWEKW